MDEYEEVFEETAAIWESLTMNYGSQMAISVWALHAPLLFLLSMASG